MKRKIYTSMSVPHFSVGNNIRIAFTPLSTKSSYYETTDEALQEKIEAHPWYGDKFRLKSVEDLDAKAAKEEAEAEATTPEEPRKISFSTLADAKEWLAKEYDVSRGSIKKKEDAVSVAKSHGVEMEIGIKNEEVRIKKICFEGVTNS